MPVHHTALDTGLRVMIAGLALLGMAGVLPVSLAEISVGGACPHLGPIPACHLVSVAYAIVLLSAVHRRFWRPSVFLFGWLPVFALAATGSGLEVLGRETCPRTTGGTPRCYLSLALTVLLIVLFLIHLSIRKLKIRQQ